MNYQNPQLLYALFALAIPILIHLFNLRKYETINFSSIRFLKDIKQNNKRKRNLKNILVLLSRLLAITFLILAFCKPFIASKEINISKNIFIYIDNSFSMDALEEDGRLMDIAKNYANQIILSHKNDNLFLITNNFDNKNILEIKLKDLATKINNLETNGKIRSLDNIIKRKNSISNNRDIVYIISDFQNIFLEEQLVDRNTNIINLIPLNKSKTSNISVDSIWINQPIITSKSDIEFFVKISNHSNSNAELPISLEIDNKTEVKKTIRIEKYNSITTSFKVLVSNSDFSGQISIEDYPINFDNKLYFSLNRSKKTNILNIYESSTISNLKNLYLDTSLFNYSAADINNIKFSELNKQDLIILNEIDFISPVLNKYIINILKNGGNISLIPSENADVNNYNDLFLLFNVNTINSIDTSKNIIEKINLEHPLLSNVFEGELKKVVFPQTSFTYKFNKNKKSVRSILTQSNNQDFLSQKTLYSGNLYLFNSPLSHKENSFKNHALFVPTFINMALESTNINSLFNVIDDNNSFVSSKKIENKIYHLKNSEIDIIPTTKFSNGKYIFQTNNKIQKAGHYFLTIKDSIIENISFNFNSKESNLSLLNNKEIIKIINNTNTSILESNLNEIDQVIKNKSLGKEYWKLCILLSLIFFGLEIILIKTIKK